MHRLICEDVFNRPLLITPGKLEAIVSVLDARGRGIHADSGTLDALRAEAASRRQSTVAGSVAVLPILGTIYKRGGMLEESSGFASTDAIGREFDRLMADESVGAIVLDVDSPGGETFGIQELGDKIFAARGQKRIVASANAEAASAAYWIASQADELVVTPSGWVGSIGVLMAHTDWSAFNEAAGLKVTYIHAGDYKVEGNPDEPLSPESASYFQGQVDAIYQQFLKTVARGRGTTTADVRANYGKGRMLLAADAKAVGMVDRIETLQETVARLAGGGKKRGGPSSLARNRLALHERLLTRGE